MDLLQITQQFCLRTGLASPSFVVSSTDPQITQIQALLNEVCAYVTENWNWEALNQEAVFTSVASELQGSMETIAPIAFRSIIKDTMFDRTQNLPITGPVSAVEWQAIKAMPATGPLYRYRLRTSSLYFTPTPTAGHTIAFEYQSAACIYNYLDTEYKELFTKDTDVFVLPAEILLLGLRWKWKAEKGLPYAEEFNTFEAYTTAKNGRDGTKPTLNMAGGTQSIGPGIYVPAGSWSIP